jgi:Dyp-type peroxidase family
MPDMGTVSDHGFTEPVLDVDDIQGNILAGFNKDHQLLLAIRIKDLSTARAWIRRILPSINSLSEVNQFNGLFRMRRARLSRDPMGLIATWANIAFSFDGMAALTSTSDAKGILDNAFQDGLPSRAASLHDPLPAGKTDPTADWVIGGTGNVPDILLIIASDDPDELHQKAERLKPSTSDGPNPPEVIWQEMGSTRPDAKGHEHFGFKDGVSQPGVRGLVSNQADNFLTPRLLVASPAQDVEFAAPGKPLVWPGQFVFGYPSTDGDSGSIGGPVAPPELRPPWLRNGSLLVFRRLKQDVAAFHRFLKTEAERLAGKAGFEGMTVEHLGARIVGRWKSGAPIMRAPEVDNHALADSSLASNHFQYTVDTPPANFKPGSTKKQDRFPLATADPNGVICPHAAHVRKVNPRDHDSDKGDRFDTLTRRILRRGIPYGKPLADPLVDDGLDRGLHFLCYQTSIEQQFELLQTDWANTTLNPKPGGHDLIIGQSESGGARTFELSTANNAVDTITAPRLFVVPTGGGYFFSPSISALRDVFARSG